MLGATSHVGGGGKDDSSNSSSCHEPHQVRHSSLLNFVFIYRYLCLYQFIQFHSIQFIYYLLQTSFPRPFQTSFPWSGHHARSKKRIHRRGDEGLFFKTHSKFELLIYYFVKNNFYYIQSNALQLNYSL